jgi:hypothetical protein
MNNDFIIGKKYIIEDYSGIYVTATITFEDEKKIRFKDRDNLEGGLLKSEIKRWKEVKE